MKRFIDKSKYEDKTIASYFVKRKKTDGDHGEVNNNTQQPSTSTHQADNSGRFEAIDIDSSSTNQYVSDDIGNISESLLSAQQGSAALTRAT